MDKIRRDKVNKMARVKSRNQLFATRIKSSITLETPADCNRFLAKSMRIHGYDVLELMGNHSFEEIFYLIFKGELPDANQRRLFRFLSIFLINPGPRHSSARAAANAAIGRTDPVHIVPIAAMAASGFYNGAKEVEEAMRFLRRSKVDEPHSIADAIIPVKGDRRKGDRIIAPGFGTDYGGQSPYLLEVKKKIKAISPESGFLFWADDFVNALPADTRCGWRSAGLIAAVLLDSGFEPRMGGGIFQILSAPGAFAHGMEFATRPITELPFIPDTHYEIRND